MAPFLSGGSSKEDDVLQINESSRSPVDLASKKRTLETVHQEACRQRRLQRGAQLARFLTRLNCGFEGQGPVPKYLGEGRPDGVVFAREFGGEVSYEVKL